jgi:hypothetical protein
MTDAPGNGFRTPYRYLTLAMLSAVLLLGVVILMDLRSVSLSLSAGAGEHVQLGRAIERLVTAVDEQTYLLDQVLPEARRLGLGMPPTLRRRIELGREYPGDPWQRRHPTGAREPRLSAPGTGG